MSETPEPGLYPDVPYPEYAAWPCMRASLLTGAILDDGSVSMKHLKAHLDGRLRKDSKALQVGRMIHTRLLEPDEFWNRYRMVGECQTLIGSGRRKGQPCGRRGVGVFNDTWYCGIHVTPILAAEMPDNAIDTAQVEVLEEMIQEIGKHPVIRLFKIQGGVELSFVWNQPVKYIVDGKEKETTVLMKGRVDKDIADPRGIPPTVADLKKTRVGHHGDWAFEKAVKKYHYDIPAALYVDGLEILTGVRREFVWVVIEDGWPHDVNVIRADPATLEIGRGEYQKLLSLYAACRETDRWPGVHDDVHWGGLSEWAKKQHGKGD